MQAVTGFGGSGGGFDDSHSARLVNGWHAIKFIKDTQVVDWLLFFPMLAIAVSCPCIIVSLACTVCERYDCLNNGSALLWPTESWLLPCSRAESDGDDSDGQGAPQGGGGVQRTPVSARAEEILRGLRVLEASFMRK